MSPTTDAARGAKLRIQKWAPSIFHALVRIQWASAPSVARTGRADFSRSQADAPMPVSTSSPPKITKSGGRCATKIGSAIARTSPITPPAARGPPDGRRRPSGPSAPAPESLVVDRAPFCQQPFQASFAFKWAGRARDVGLGAPDRDAVPLNRTHDGSYPADLQLQRAKSLDPSCAWRRFFAPPPQPTASMSIATR